MPRWTFEYSPDSLSNSEREALARKIFEAYVEIGIPAFLVNVFFHELPTGHFYSGGKAQPDAIFFHIDHAASGFPNEDRRLRFIARVNKIVRPILRPKNIKWEYNIYEHPRLNWRVNGMIPPVEHPEIWQQWIDRNEAVVYDETKPSSIQDKVQFLKGLND